jgi:hypothetical protein
VTVARRGSSFSSAISPKKAPSSSVATCQVKQVRSKAKSYFALLQRRHLPVLHCVHRDVPGLDNEEVLATRALLDDIRALLRTKRRDADMDRAVVWAGAWAGQWHG